jgi:hypothetical protein
MKQDELGGARSTSRGTQEVHTGFWCGDLMERDNLVDLGQMEYYYGS